MTHTQHLLGIRFLFKTMGVGGVDCVAFATSTMFNSLRACLVHVF